MFRHSPAPPHPRAGLRPAPPFRTLARCPIWPVLLASLVAASPAGAQSDGRIWGRVVTTGDEIHEGFLRFHGEQDAASWVDAFRSIQDVPSDGSMRASWLDASRGGSPFIRTIELRGYRISWNDRSDLFPSERTLRVPFGSIGTIVIHGHNIEVVLRNDPAGVADSVGRAGRGPRPRASRRFIGRMERHWGDTRIDVEHPLRGNASVLGDDVRRIELSAVPGGHRASSARLFGSVLARSGRTFQGLITWDNRAVLQSDTLRGRFEGSARPAIRFEEIRSIERSAGRAQVTLVSGDVVAMAGGVGRQRDPAREVTVADPWIGTVTIDWDDLSVLHLRPEGARADQRLSGSGQAGETGLAGGLAYDDFDAGTLLHGVVLTHDGEAVEGWIRWNAIRGWSWDRLYASSADVGVAVEFGNIRTIEQLGQPDHDPGRGRRPGVSMPGRALVTLLNGDAYEMTGTSDLGSGNLGILVRTDSSRAEPDAPSGPGSESEPGDGAASGDWRFVAWEDVREIRFEQSGAGSRNR